MTEEAKVARRAYYREYYKTHKKECETYQARYWARKFAQGSTDSNKPEEVKQNN